MAPEPLNALNSSAPSNAHLVFNGLERSFASLTPSVIRFYVRSDSTTGAKGYFVFGGTNIVNSNTAVFFIYQRQRAYAR